MTQPSPKPAETTTKTNVVVDGRSDDGEEEDDGEEDDNHSGSDHDHHDDWDVDYEGLDLDCDFLEDGSTNNIDDDNDSNDCMDSAPIKTKSKKTTTPTPTVKAKVKKASEPVVPTQGKKKKM